MNEGCHSTVAQSCWSFLSRAFTSLVFWQSDFNPTFLSFWADYSISSFLDCFFASSLLRGIATASLRWTALCCTDALSQLNANQLWRRHSLEMAGMDPCLSCPSPCAWYHGGCSRMGPTDTAGLAGSLRARIYLRTTVWVIESNPAPAVNDNGSYSSAASTPRTSMGLQTPWQIKHIFSLNFTV